MAELTHEAMADMVKQLYDQQNEVIRVLRTIARWATFLGFLALLTLIADACSVLGLV